MLEYLAGLRVRDLLLREAPTFAASLVIAELFYKFHTFSLELIAFMATWVFFGAVVRWIAGKSVSGKESDI